MQEECDYFAIFVPQYKYRNSQFQSYLKLADVTPIHSKGQKLQ